MARFLEEQSMYPAIFLCTIAFWIATAPMLLAQADSMNGQGKVIYKLDIGVQSTLDKSARKTEQWAAEESVWRIQILSESGNDAKSKAQECRDKFTTASKWDLPVFIVYQQPNFKVRVGTFHTKLEAARYLKQIKTTYPNAFIVKDQLLAE